MFHCSFFLGCLTPLFGPHHKCRYLGIMNFLFFSLSLGLYVSFLLAAFRRKIFTLFIDDYLTGFLLVLSDVPNDCTRQFIFEKPEGIFYDSAV